MNLSKPQKGTRGETNTTSSVLASSALTEIVLLRLPQVLSIIPVARSTWWGGIKAGKFPRPIKLGARSVAWRAMDIQALVERLTNETAPAFDARGVRRGVRARISESPPARCAVTPRRVPGAVAKAQRG
jgi:predicted DNA-binding transcriptional regulator AlpA